MTVRWRFEDTVDDSFTFLPINPNEMSSPTFQRNVQFGWTSNGAGGTDSPGSGSDVDGRVRLADSGASVPLEWTFGGVINTEAHYQLLLTWAKKCRVLRVTDHLGRTFEIIIQKFDPTPRRRTGANEWRYTYTMSCLLLKEVT